MTLHKEALPKKAALRIAAEGPFQANSQGTEDFEPGPSQTGTALDALHVRGANSLGSIVNIAGIRMAENQPSIPTIDIMSAPRPVGRR